MKDYRNAVSLALAIDQPGKLLGLLKAIIGSDDSTLYGVIRNLPHSELQTLLRHVRGWNATAKHFNIAQAILHAIFKLRSIDDISESFQAHDKSLLYDTAMTSSESQALSLNELVQSLIPYTERHLARLNRLVQDSYMIDYVLEEMDGGLFNEESDVLIA